MKKDYQTRVTPEKRAAVKALQDEFGKYDGFIFTDYRGMTVEQITTVRKQLMEDEGNYRVVKNRYAKIALNNLKKEGVDEQLVGPTAIALVKGDAINTAAKALFASKKAGSSIEVKGGISSDGTILTSEQLLAYSKLPGRDDCIAILMGTMKAPVQKLAATLLAYVKKNGEADQAAADAEK